MIRYIYFFENEQEGIWQSAKNFFDKYFNTTQNILIIGQKIFEGFNYLPIITSKDYDKKILVIFEPIKNLSQYKLCYKIIEDYNKYNLYLFGCVENKPEEKKIKFPLYMMERFPIYENPDMYFIKANNFIKNTDIFSKNFCCLINSWDPDNHRTKMYNILSQIKNIHCPGKLLNNCSNRKLNALGKPSYLNYFIFNICSENYDNNTYNGYITEKLMDCCLGGAIPIYAGWFDEYDAKIFNKNRIIFYNSRDEASFEKVYNQINELLEDKDKLITFYKQPIFCDTATETIQELIQNIKKLTYNNN